MSALVAWVVAAFAPGWPERFAHAAAVALLVAAALLAAFALAEAASPRGRVRAVMRGWARAAEATTTTETLRDGTLIARTTTERTARYLLNAVINEEEL